MVAVRQVQRGRGGGAALAASRGTRPVRGAGAPPRARRAAPRAAAAGEEPATEGDASNEPAAKADKAAARAARQESRRARFQSELEALTVGQEVQGKVVRSRPARPPPVRRPASHGQQCRT